MINIDYDLYKDETVGDLDVTSPTLRKYHKILWSKPLPNGIFFTKNVTIFIWFCILQTIMLQGNIFNFMNSVQTKGNKDNTFQQPLVAEISWSKLIKLLKN